MEDDITGRSRFRNIKKSVVNDEEHQSNYYPGVKIEYFSQGSDLDSAKIGMLFSIVGGIIALAIAIAQFMTSELDSDMEFLYLASGAILLVLFSYIFVLPFLLYIFPMRFSFFSLSFVSLS